MLERIAGALARGRSSCRRAARRQRADEQGLQAGVLRPDWARHVGAARL